jgi:LPS sulfotransferase NodH
MVFQSESAAAARARIEEESGPLPSPKLAYWLCGTPRTGTNLLRYALKKAGCGHPAEGYHKYANQEFGWGFDETDFIRYTRQMVERQTSAKTGIFGLKIFWEQFQYYLDQCEHPSISGGQALTPQEKVAVFFPDARFVFIRRRDKLRQAISLVKAKQSSVYIVTDKQNAPPSKPARLHYNPRMISYYLDLFAAQELLWDNFFMKSDFTHKTIWYEDFEGNYEAQVASVIEYLGLDSGPIAQPKHQKQADEHSEEWYRRYLSENPWIDDPQDVDHLLAKGHLRLLRPCWPKGTCACFARQTVRPRSHR